MKEKLGGSSMDTTINNTLTNGRYKIKRNIAKDTKANYNKIMRQE